MGKMEALFVFQYLCFRKLSQLLLRKRLQKLKMSTLERLKHLSEKNKLHKLFMW